MQAFSHPLLIAALLLIAYVMVTAVLTILAAHVKHHIDRHNLLRDTRTRRLEYELEVLQRQQNLTDSHPSILIEDDADPAPAPLRRAA